MEGKSHAGLFAAIFLALFFLTLLTVAVSRVDLGALNLAVGLGIAVAKMCLVALVFMHLKFELPPIRPWIVGVALFPLLLFVLIAFSLFPDVGYGDIARPHAKAVSSTPEHR